MLVYLSHIVLAVSVAILIFVRLRTLLTYFQQEEYNARRFVSAIRRVRLYDVVATLFLLCAGGIVAFGLTGRWVWWLAAIAILAVALRETRHRYKKPLVMTERAGRIFRLSAAVMAAVALIGLLSPFSAALALQATPLALITANAMLRPYQERINQRFIEAARAKLERMDPIRIGITGSFGKTTVKHILAEMLQASGPVFYSRGSINTVLGLTRHIRRRLQWSHRYFVAEMGAYGIGSIQRLCDFAEPDFGLITAVGDAHTERFGSIANIALAKSELAASVCGRGGHVVLNADLLSFEPFETLRGKYPGQITTVGFGKDADVTIESSELKDGVWHISLADNRREAPPLGYQIPLLGEHNVINSALAAVMATQIDPALSQRLPMITKEVEQIPHRLQKREAQGRPLVLDDAFNSNQKGFRNAVEVLSELARQRGGRAILVTPGIAELGLEHDRVHADLAASCNDLCDYVYVVNPARIPSFVSALDAAKLRIHEVATLAEARKLLAEEEDERDVILYENDLPDLLEETRLL